MLAVLSACAPSEVPARPAAETEYLTSQTATRDTAGPPDTGIAPVDPLAGCDDLPDRTPFTTLDITTEEDFDFDAEGRLVYVDFGNLVGISMGREVSLIAPNVGDVAGIQIRADGTILMATPLFNAMRWGNGIGGWDRDVLYVTNREYIFAVEAGVMGRPSPTWLP